MRTLLLAALLVVACKDERTLKLTFGVSGSMVPPPFNCKIGDNNLPIRGLDGKRFHASILIDFVRTGGLPSCELNEIANWCGSHDCESISDDPAHARRCFSYDRTVAVASNDAAVRAMGDAVANATGELISDDAPHEPVIIRAVATAQRCEEFTSNTTPFDPTRVIGCAYSCPIQLDAFEGDILLDLRTAPQMCEQNVMACARAGLPPP